MFGALPAIYTESRCMDFSMADFTRPMRGLGKREELARNGPHEVAASAISEHVFHCLVLLA
jgi:hypothetical protein